MKTPLTVLADENIAYLDAYFGQCHLIKVKGRNITQSLIDTYKPDALLIRSVTPINASTISRPGPIRFVGTATIGIDHVDTQFLDEHGIQFVSAQGSSKHSVAQYVITAILSARPAYATTPITLGILGLGNIGSTLASYASDLGWQVRGHDPYLPPSPLNNSSLDMLLTQSDVVSIHTPLTKTGDYPTYQLFDQSTLCHLKNHALLINTARGQILQQADALSAIAKQNLQLILDVFPQEPYIDKTLLDQLTIATPHIAGYTLEGKVRGSDMIYQAFCQYFDLPMVQRMDALLPPSDLSWRDLLPSLSQGRLESLEAYYDILQDDRALRAMGDEGVLGDFFDRLRKNYHLKREWRYD